MQGFIVFDYAPHYPTALAELATWLSTGAIQRKETIIRGGLTKAGEALVELYNGSNTGEYFTPFFFGCAKSRSEETEEPMEGRKRYCMAAD